MSDFTATWFWPQWVLVAIVLFNLTVAAATHGKPRDNRNAFSAFIDLSVLLFILTAGGFFA